MRDITSVLPHRPPFLFVDRIVESIPGTMARGYKQITLNEWFFTGHFPEEPIMPGVLITEAIAQLGAFAIPGHEGQPRRGMIASIGRIKFTGKVTPGDRLDLFFEVIAQKGPFTKGRGEASVENQTVATVEEIVIYSEREVRA